MKLIGKREITEQFDCWDIETEKNHNFVAEGTVVHNSNSRFVFSAKDQKMFCGSHTNWKMESDISVWWKALRQNPWIEEFCRKHPDIFIYAETFGQVQSLKYNAKPNQFFVAAFDILDHDRWLSYDECQEIIKDTPDFKWVPLVYRGPFNREMLLAEAEKNSLYPNCATQMREGIVIRPVIERFDAKLGRVFLKMVSNRHLEKGS
jgi:RNA ligase (TIGR02306 family)